MSKTILTKVNGWTPIIDSIVEDCGLTTAAVFGVIWRFCQMRNGVCSASQDTLAERLGISRQTMNVHIKMLVEKGYLEFLEDHGITRVIRDTGKAGIGVYITSQPVKPEPEKAAEPVNKTDSPIPEPVKNFDRLDEEKSEPVKEFDRSVKKLDNTCQNSLQQPVKKFDTNKTLLRDSLGDKLRDSDFSKKFAYAKRQVEFQTSRDYFQKYVSGLELDQVREEDGIAKWVVKAGCAYNAELLTDRFGDMFNRILSGMVNKKSVVEFQGG